MNEVERSRMARVITWLIVGLLVVLLLRLLFAVLGFALSMLIPVLVLIAIGWAAMKMWERHDRGRDSTI